jgi:uncharacterized protein (TIGR02217 family)
MFEEFLDIYLDDLIAGFPCYSSPRFSTSIAASWSGAEVRNRNWTHPLRTFKLPEAVREHAQYEAIQDHWFVMGGPERAFPFTDPLDFASVPLELANVVPDISSTDQLLGEGDGVTRDFQLQKTYERSGATYTRPIYLPQAGEVLVALDGIPPEDVLPGNGGPYTWTVSRPGGVITFTPAPAPGLEVTAGFLFDVAVRFEADDSFDGIVQSFQVSGFSDLSFVEVRPC